MEIGELLACIFCIFILCYVSVLYIKLGIKLQDHARIFKWIFLPLWLLFADECGQGMLSLSGALKGKADAQAKLALQYMSGTMPGTYKKWYHLWWPTSKERGDYWLQKALSTSKPEAERVIANAYIEGNMGLPRDLARGVAILRKVVDNPDSTEAIKSEAAYNLFQILSEPGRYQDLASAARYCMLAADGNGQAAYQLAQMYENGDIGEPDVGKAFAYYKHAVERGCPEAMGSYARLAKQLGQK
jgi:TPR repeat protein